MLKAQHHKGRGKGKWTDGKWADEGCYHCGGHQLKAVQTLSQLYNAYIGQRGSAEAPKVLNRVTTKQTSIIKTTLMGIEAKGARHMS